RVGVMNIPASSPRARLALGVLLALAALAVSVGVRVQGPGHTPRAADESDLASAASAEAAPGGQGAGSLSLLLDLDDDVGEPTRGEVGRRVDEAIAPYDWPDGSLGAELSDAARLYRLRVPASELRDLVRALRGAAAVESLEAEHSLHLPVDPRAVDFTPEDAAPLDAGSAQ